MLDFRRTMDPHALDVVRVLCGDRRRSFHDAPVCGSIQWHKDRPPRLVVRDTDQYTLDEMKQLVAKLEEMSNKVATTGWP